MTGHIDMNLFIYERKAEMSEKKKVMICCGSEEDLGSGFKCDIEEIEKGYRITMTSDDPGVVQKLRARFISCCDSGDDKSSCC
jgi:hypothetical protein